MTDYNMSGVYVIMNTINGHRYIGSSYNMRRRWNEHRSVLNHNKSTNRILQNAWNLYGSEAFTFTVLEYVCDHDLLVPTEQKYLTELNPEYNIRKIADRCTGLKRTPESRAKMSVAAKGRQRSEEYKSNMSKILKNREFTPEWREHLKEAQARRVITDKDKAEFQRRMNTPEVVAKRNAVRKLREKPTAETRQKLRLARLGKRHSPETRAKQSASIRRVKQQMKQQTSGQSSLWDESTG